MNINYFFVTLTLIIIQNETGISGSIRFLNIIRHAIRWMLQNKDHYTRCLRVVKI